jgi:hypothetical protein
VRCDPGDGLPPHIDNPHEIEAPADVLARRLVANLYLDSWNGWEDEEGSYDGGLFKLHIRQSRSRFRGAEPDATRTVSIAGRAGTLLVYSATVMHEVARVQSGRRRTVVAFFV